METVDVKPITKLIDDYKQKRRTAQANLNFLRDHHFDAELIVAHKEVETLDGIIIDLELVLNPPPF